MLFYSHMNWIVCKELLYVLDTLCQISELIVNVEKTKIMAIKVIQPRHHPAFTYKRQLIYVLQNLRCIGIIVSFTNLYNVCHESRL